MFSIRQQMSIFTLSAWAIFSSSLTSTSLSGKSIAYPDTDYFEQSPGHSGGTLKTSASYEPGSLDIHTQASGNLLWEGRWLFDSLIYLDAQGKPTPWLARSWSVSADGLVYTFHLRPDVSFSDGTRFDATAVKVNFDRIKQLGVKSRISSAYLEPYLSGAVINDFTFEAHLSHPYSPFFSYLAQTWLGMISPRQILLAPETIARHPIGTGPFLIAEYQPKVRAVFKRRADYAWAPDYLRHRGPAYLDGIVLDAVGDDSIRSANLQSGVHQLNLEASPQSAPDVRANNHLIFSNRVRPGSPMRSLAFNTRRFPFSDIRLRWAVALALDREALTQLIGAGELIPTSGYLDVNTPGYDNSFEPLLAYNPRGADALLDEAGWAERGKDGIRIKDGHRLTAELLTTGSERTPPQSVQVMQADLRTIGFDLQLRHVLAENLPALVQKGQYDALTGGWWSGVTPDVLFLLYHSSQIARQNSLGQDTANLADPRLDDVLWRARLSSDSKEQSRLYREAQRLLAELVPVVPLHESQHLLAYDRSLHGVLFDTAHNTPFLTAAWLDGGQAAISSSKATLWIAQKTVQE